MVLDPSPVSYGDKPDYNTSKLNLEKSLKQTLFDPYSIKDFSIKEIPKKCYWKKNHKVGLIYNTIYGWCYEYELNAKNRMGGYTGLKKDIWHEYTNGTIKNMKTYGGGYAD